MHWRAHRHAPAPGSLLCRLDALPQGACRELRYGEGDASFSLLLYRRDTEVRAYVNCCPHFSLPLNARANEFLLYGDGLIMCAHHSAVFRLVDGRCVDGLSAGEGLEPVPVRLVGNEIFLADA
jgi:nitrite reductase/ring-hydroxylating ferredoxin subunit